ncbi:L-fucose permease [Escherichia coli]|uniref:L-fucose permease n=1 Tax=Escherichia coli TaxID=562 RepID=A0A376UGE2_ECOLX|nr:L-fucose permease [Escherichia coli]
MGNTSIQTQSYRAVDKDAGQSRSYIIPFALLCSLFFLWAVANNLNDILLPQFQQAFTLTNFQAGLIQSAFTLVISLSQSCWDIDEKTQL